jgi:hypothetical protein
MLRSHLLAFALLLVMTPGRAQSTETETFRHGIGIGAGFTTGYGLSYRYTPGKFAMQANFAPYKDKESARYSAGITFLYTLIPGKITSLYLYQANHYFYDSQVTYYTDAEKKFQTMDVTPIRDKVTDSFFNNGIGFGMEIIFARRIGFNLMMGYAAYDNFNQINVTGETALYFKF